MSETRLTGDGYKTADPAVVKRLFMASEHVEWSPFARSQKWDPIESRKHFPYAEWSWAKKARINRERAEELSQKIFHHKMEWHEEALKTLRELPQLNDAAIVIVKQKLQLILTEIRDNPTAFAARPASDFISIASAVKILTESKQKSMLMHNWDLKLGEQAAVIPDEAIEGQAKKADFVIVMKGGETMTSDEIIARMTKHYDPDPKALPPKEPSPVEEALDGED